MRTGTEAERETFLAKLLDTALTQIPHPWASILKWEWHPEEAPHGGDDAEAVIMDSSGTVWPVRPQDVATGLRRLVDDQRRLPHFSSINGVELRQRERILRARTHNDIFSMTRDDADVVVQVALFGEVRYK